MDARKTKSSETIETKKSQSSTRLLSKSLKDAVPMVDERLVAPHSSPENTSSRNASLTSSMSSEDESWQETVFQGYGFSVDQAHAIFSLNDTDEDKLKKYAREFSHQLGISFVYQIHRYQSGFAIEGESSERVQYDFKINNYNTGALAKMIWCIGKLTNSWPDPDRQVGTYLSSGIMVKPLDKNNGQQQCIESVGYTLQRATQMALDRKDEPFELRFDTMQALRHGVEDRRFWTQDEKAQYRELIKQEREAEEKQKWDSSWTGTLYNKAAYASATVQGALGMNQQQDEEQQQAGWLGPCKLL